jgi:hypothetical protein
LQGVQDVGRILARQVRGLITAEVPLVKARLTIRAPSDSDTMPTWLSAGLVQAIANTLSMRVGLSYLDLEGMGPLGICPGQAPSPVPAPPG